VRPRIFSDFNRDALLRLFVCRSHGAVQRDRSRLRQPSALANAQAGKAIGRRAAPRIPLVRIMKIRFFGCRSVLLGLALLVACSAFAAVPPSPPFYNIRMENAWIPMKD